MRKVHADEKTYHSKPSLVSLKKKKKSCKKVERFRDVSHSRQINSFHGLTFLPHTVQTTLKRSKPPFPCCVCAPSVTKNRVILKGKQNQH